MRRINMDGVKMTKKLAALALCAVLVLTLCACKPDNTPEGNTSEPNTLNTSEPSQVTETTDEPTTETTTEPTTEKLVLTVACAESVKGIIEEGSKGNMRASFNKDGFLESEVKWTSSAPDVLFVQEDGTYECRGIGKVQVTAAITKEDETATKSVTFDVQKLVKSAEFNETSIELKAGFTHPIGAKALPEDATDTSIHWLNSNPNIAAIDKKTNQLVGYRQGQCVLTACNNRGDKLGEVSVNVLPGPIYGADEEFGNQIVEYTTYFNPNKANRTTNLKVAANAIMAYQGGVLAPGQQFSFNAWVGERTRAKGYLDAGVFSGSKEETGLAGGICQVSTTLFNAALLANFRIDARSPHSMDPQYGKPGQDAAIQWPSTDLRFTNTLNVPVKIVYQFSGNAMTVRLFTPGETYYPLPEVWIEQGGSGLNYWMKRHVNGEVNYSCTTRYVAYHP